jgi:hypothetical protein
MADKTPEQIKHEAEQRRRAQHEAKTGAATSTYNAASKGQDLADPRGDTFLTHDEIHHLAGDIAPGELGFLKLDEEGHPTGTVIRDIRSVHDDSPKATVIASPQHKWDDIVTPSGAPVTKFMNPDPTLWDPGMLARNPPPAPTEQDRKHPLVGGGVVNQPVTV